MPEPEEAVKALVDGVPTELVFVADGYMAPRSFRVEQDLGTLRLPTRLSLATRESPEPPRKGPTVTIDVEIEGKRVISKRVVVEDPEGVSSITLRRVQIREFVAMKLLQLLMRPRVQPDGTMRLTIIAEDEIDDALAIVRRLVGYAPQVIGGGRPYHYEEPEE